MEAFARRVREALAAPADSTLAAMFPAASITALVVDANDAVAGPTLECALVGVRDALERVGIARGRQFVLLGRGSSAPAPGLRACAEALRERLSIAVFAHDPGAAAFTAGVLASGEPIALDDELREAEAVVCVGRGDATSTCVDGGPYLLVPGVASLATREAFAHQRARAGERGALAFAMAAETLAPVDLALTWDAAGTVTAGRGRDHFAALARAAGFA